MVNGQVLEDRLFGALVPGLEHLLNTPNMVFFEVVESVITVEWARCEIVVAWKSYFPNHLGMALPKGSPLYEVKEAIFGPEIFRRNVQLQIFQYQTLRQLESGASILHAAREELSRGSADCGLLASEALSFEKLISLFG